MRSWEEIRKWRRSKRSELLAKRYALSQPERRGNRAALVERILKYVPELTHGYVGLYWPIKGEIDVRGLIADTARTSLPVVVTERAPLEFWKWHPGMKLGRGIWDIPIPAEREVVHPSVLLVPLVGFDAAGYRLGYGGGYYDRTLAAMSPKPIAIGVGFEIGRLATIHPQLHDIPMDAIATEAGVQWFRDCGDLAHDAFAGAEQ